MPKQVTETKVVVQYSDGSVSVKSERAANSEIEEAKKKGEETGEIVKAQTFGYLEPTTIDEILSVVPNEKEALNIFLYGFSLKGNTIERQILLDEAFAAQDGVWDLSGELAEIRERKKMSPMDKAARLLGLDPAKLAELVAQVNAGGVPA